MRVLLDTCVVSELRKPRPDSKVVAELRSYGSESYHLSIITMGELCKGIAALADIAKKEKIMQWYQQLERQFADRIFPVDREVAVLWGEMAGSMQRRGKVLATADGLIAATAQTHRLTLVTRNTRDFADTGIKLLNPWG